MSAIAEKARAYERHTAGEREEADRYERMLISSDEMATRAIALRQQAADLDDQAAELRVEAEEGLKELKIRPTLAEPPSSDDLRAKIEAANRTNDQVRKVIAANASAKQASDKRREVETLEATMEQIDAEVQAAILKADLPSGMEIKDGLVMLRGVRFDQGSESEKLRASIGLGILMNPTLKVMRIAHGAALDDDAWSVLSEVAVSEGYQIFLESVRPIGPAAIILEDGRVKS